MYDNVMLKMQSNLIAYHVNIRRKKTYLFSFKFDMSLDRFFIWLSIVIIINHLE